MPQRGATGPRLRTAGPQDEERLLAWRNDATVRGASFGGDEISADTHRRWFAARLSDPEVAILIVELDGRALGQVRLEHREPGTAEVHIGLAAEARGRGVGSAALRTAVGEARRWPDVRQVRARVKPENAASLRAFEAAGFTEVARSPEAVELRAAVD